MEMQHTHGTQGSLGGYYKVTPVMTIGTVVALGVLGYIVYKAYYKKGK